MSATSSRAIGTSDRMIMLKSAKKAKGANSSESPGTMKPVQMVASKIQQAKDRSDAESMKNPKHNSQLEGKIMLSS
jgi:hypothetical protein